MADPQTAIFAGGCFWCLEAVFDRVIGVTGVTSGYAGGQVAKPTYEQVCDGTTGHAEVVKVDFDAATISYRDLLNIFFAIHDPTTKDRQGNDVGTQYRSAVFYLNEEQRQTAEAVIADLAAQFPAPIATAVQPAPEFYPGEKYHQDYFTNNPNQPYCQAVVAPKVKKFLKTFADKAK